MTTVFDYSVTAADGSPYPLAQHRGQVLLIVNTASRCGFTPQYQGLEALWRRYRDAGLTILGFPCNQFAAQEPGDAAEIARFCTLQYDVSFPVLAKVAVNGSGAEPLYDHLTQPAAAARHAGGEVELHEVPRRARRPGHRPIRPRDEAGRPGGDGSGRALRAA